MKRILICTCFSLIAAVCFAQEKQKMINQYFQALVNNDQFNGGVMVIEKDKVIYRQSFGYVDATSKDLHINKDTRFALASISKTILATAVLQLADKGKLSITDKVSGILPWFPYSGISVQQLLSHTSGLPPYNAYFDSLKEVQPQRVFVNADVPSVMKHSKVPLLYEPGSNGNYDNINYLILALVIEEITGQPYQYVVWEQILKPARMTSTVNMTIGYQLTHKLPFPYAWPALQPHLYSDTMVKAMHVPYIVEYWKAYNFSGFGQYVSTMEDMYRYAKAWTGTQLLSEKMKAQVFTPVTLNNGKSNSANFGLGWQIAGDSSLGKIIYHSGNSTGLSCILLRNISKYQVIIVFDNIHGNNAQSVAFAVSDILNGRSVAVPKKSLAYTYGKLLVKEGVEKATKSFYQLQKDTSRFYLNEDEMNLLGYDFLGGPNSPNPYKFPEVTNHPAALVTFKLNTELFPGSWNVYDSYGEALMMTGNKKEAINMYKKSLELNPGNTAGKEIMERLEKER